METTDLAGLEERLGAVMTRVRAACLRVGRDPSAVTVVAVSKTYSVESIRLAYACGIRDFGENRTQELQRKAERISSDRSMANLRWHMIGHVQRNKVRNVVKHADLIHSVDSVRVASEYDRRAREVARNIDVLVQVNVSGESNKSGFEPDELPSALIELALLPNVTVQGLMGMAQFVHPPELARPQFRLLSSILNDWNRSPPADIRLSQLSMGMSNDFDIAVEEGATMIRVGSDIFGKRA